MGKRGLIPHRTLGYLFFLWRRKEKQTTIIANYSFKDDGNNNKNNTKCKLCQLDEAIDDIISAGSILAKVQYVKRHDKASVQTHFNICKEIGVQLDKKHWYEHVPKSVVTNQGGKVTILWNQQVQTDRTILNNKPVIIIRDNEKRICMLIRYSNPRWQKCD
jgi:hypothetical protein